MRSFSKKLAFVLAAAMVFTSFAPAAKAEAAKEMVINKSSQILYVTDGDGINDAAQVGGGKGNVSEYDFYVKNKPDNWKKTLKFEWSSSDEDVATVNQSGLTTAVGVGKATISCKITEKKTGDVVTTSKVKVTVKANAAAIEIKNADKIANSVLVLEDGKATLDLDRVMYDAYGNKTTKRGTYVTDYTEWLYEPKTGVDVKQSNGVFTFTAPGEYKLSCRTYQSSKYTGTTAESDPIVVTVVDYSYEIKQTTSKVIELKFAQKADISKGDVAIVQNVTATSGKIEEPNYIVKNVTMSKDGLTATVETFRKFVDGGNYTVKINDGKVYDNQKFDASVGYPTSMKVYVGDNVDNRIVTVGQNTPLKYKLYDAKKVDVTDEFNTNRNVVSYKIKYSNTYELSGRSDLYFTKENEYATVVATYYPAFQYDTTTGQQLGSFSTEPITFQAKAQNAAAVLGLADYTVNQYNWSAKSVRLKDTNPKLWVKIAQTHGNPIEFNKYDAAINVNGQFMGYTNFTALTPDILGVYEQSDDTVLLVPHKLGTAEIGVSVAHNQKNENLIGVAYIEVKEPRVMTNVGYANGYIDICSNPGDTKGQNTTAVEDMTIALNVKDQDNQNYGNFQVLGIKGANAVSTRAINNGVTLNTTNGSLLVENRKLDAILNSMSGDLFADATQNARYYTFGFEVSVKDRATQEIRDVYFAVNTVNHIGDQDHDEYWGHGVQLVLNSTDLDKNGNDIERVEHDNNATHKSAEKKLEFTVYEICNGVKYDEVEFNLINYDMGDVVNGVYNVTDGYYVKVFRDGVDVTLNAQAKATALDTANVLTSVYGAPLGSKATYRLSGVDKSTYDATKMIAVYGNDARTIGKATYEFVLYSVTKNPANSATAYTVNRLDSRYATVDYQPDGYEYSFRKAITANSKNDRDILKCFEIKDRAGVAYDVNNVTDTTAKFGNSVRNYKLIYDVNTKNSLKKGETLFIEAVVFWETLGDGTFAEYVVPINNFVDFKQTIY